MRSGAVVRILAILVTTGLVACAPAAEQAAPEPAAPAVDRAAEEQAIRDLSMQWLGAEQERDLLTAMSFVDANATSIFDGEIRRGRAELEAAAEARWAKNPDATISWSTSSVDVAASGDLAYERGSWVYDPDGPGDGQAEGGEFVTVWKKLDGEWKVVVDAGSTIKG